MTSLTGEQIRELSSKLSGTLSLHDLEAYVYASTGDRLFHEYVGTGLPLKKTIYNLLIALEDAGTTQFFLSYVYKERRVHRPDVAQAIENVFPEAATQPPEIDGDIQVQNAGKPQENGPTKAAAPGLQRNVTSLEKLDLHIWIEKLARIERRVCRVECNGNAAGTGFLVGPNVVLTNWHVVQDAVQGGDVEFVSCHFDYYRFVNNARNLGVSVAVASDGCVSRRPYSSAEKTNTPDRPEPTQDELDYALLRLTEPIGSKDANGQTRGWIALPNTAVPLAEGAPLLIVQHPDGAPLKLALDTNAVIRLNDGQTRLLYSTNTEAGSSGSPCFDIKWNLAALHQYGDPAWQNPKFNQGVPVHLIRQKIASDGFAELLGTEQA